MWTSTAYSKRSAVLLLGKRRFKFPTKESLPFYRTRTYHATHVVNALGKFSWTLDSHVIRSCILRPSQVSFHVTSTVRLLING